MPFALGSATSEYASHPVDFQVAGATPAPGTQGRAVYLAQWPAGFGGSFPLFAVAKPFDAKSPSSWHPGLLNWSQLAVLPPTTLVIIRWQHSEWV